MALNGILSIDLAVKNPDELSEFWQRRGLTADASGTLGTADRNKQITIVEDDYRHLAALHLSCETEQDLANITKRLHDMGVDSIISGTTLTCKDPIVDHAISVEVGAPAPLTPYLIAASTVLGRSIETDCVQMQLPRRNHDLRVGSVM